MIGIEGATSPIYIDTIPAPLPTYKVEFINDDGTILSSQTVLEGQTAITPENPSKEGYDFIGWDTGITNIHDDLTIKAQYIKKKYTVVFVDWNNESIEIKEFNYGDILEGPVDPQKEGSAFVGWSTIIGEDVTTVTNNMIVTAKYELNEYKVTFLNWDGTVLNEQYVEYGSAADSPDELLSSMENLTFANWSNFENYLFVTGDIIISPQAKYESTVSTPIASITTGSYTGIQHILLSSNTPNAKIYYTTDGSSPYYEDQLEGEIITGTLYTGPIILLEDTTLTFIAVSDDMNNSEVVIEEYLLSQVPILGDINLDGRVDVRDYAILIQNYKTDNVKCDINGDGIVNMEDLALLISNFGKRLI
jgi:hypothetical protein